MKNITYAQSKRKRSLFFIKFNIFIPSIYARKGEIDSGQLHLRVLFPLILSL